ncbi:hypothetical protein [Stenotrophomonas sp. PS02289]|uniref:hypothetical protein n=1 Tax=Stenotrophomonas sp. PS02289 TaxID=2991422 RepID=UPI00249B1DCA|nr:hypothetical protein [Stenotrophomonas sp. PS02289]
MVLMMLPTVACAQSDSAPLTATERLAELKSMGAPTHELLADDSSMEFASAAEFLRELPARKGVVPDTARPALDGGSFYTNDPDPLWNVPLGEQTVRDGDRISWMLLASPHPAAPAVLRVHDHAVTGPDGITHVTSRLGLLCEGEAEACAELHAVRRSMIPALRDAQDE